MVRGNKKRKKPDPMSSSDEAENPSDNGTSTIESLKKNNEDLQNQNIELQRQLMNMVKKIDQLEQEQQVKQKQFASQMERIQARERFHNPCTSKGMQIMRPKDRSENRFELLSADDNKGNDKNRTEDTDVAFVNQGTYPSPPRKDVMEDINISEFDAMGDNESLEHPVGKNIANKDTSIGKSKNISRNNISRNQNSSSSGCSNQTIARSKKANKNEISKDSVSNANINQGRKKVMQAIETSLFKVREQITAAKCTSFTVHQAKLNAPVKIVVTDEQEVDTIKAALSNAKVSYHEYKWADEKQKCFIIRGLVGATEEDLPVFRQELIELGLPTGIVLALHHTGYMRANPNKQHNVLVKLILPPNFEESTLLNIRYLNHVAVRFELFKSKSIVQCKNCQRFGHSAGGCQHQHRCVKCGQNHLRDNCPRTTNAHFKLKCCNCNGEHTANNLTSCSYFQQHFAKKLQQSPATRDAHEGPAVKTAPPASRQPGISFADVLGRASVNSKTSAGNTRSDGVFQSNLSMINQVDNNFSKFINAISDLRSQNDRLNEIITKHGRLLEMIMTKLENV